MVAPGHNLTPHSWVLREPEKARYEWVAGEPGTDLVAYWVGYRLVIAPAAAAHVAGGAATLNTHRLTLEVVEVDPQTLSPSLAPTIATLLRALYPDTLPPLRLLAHGVDGTNPLAEQLSTMLPPGTGIEAPGGTWASLDGRIQVTGVSPVKRWVRIAGWPPGRMEEIRRQIDQRANPFDVLTAEIVTEREAWDIAASFLCVDLDGVDPTVTLLQEYADESERVFAWVVGGEVEAVLTSALVARAMEQFHFIPTGQPLTAVLPPLAVGQLLGGSHVTTNRFPLSGGVAAAGDQAFAGLGGGVGVRIHHQGAPLVPGREGKALLPPGGQLRVTRIVDTFDRADSGWSRVYDLVVEPASPAGQVDPGGVDGTLEPAVAAGAPLGLWNRAVDHVLRTLGLASILTPLTPQSPRPGPQTGRPMGLPPMKAVLDWLERRAADATSDEALGALGPVPGQRLAVEVVVGARGDAEGIGQLLALLAAVVSRDLNLGLTRFAERQGWDEPPVAVVRYDFEEVGDAPMDWIRVRYLGLQTDRPAPYRQLKGQRAETLTAQHFVAPGPPLDDRAKPVADYLSVWRTSTALVTEDGWWQLPKPLRRVDEIVRDEPDIAFRSVRTLVTDVADPVGNYHKLMLRRFVLEVAYDVARVGSRRSTRAAARWRRKAWYVSSACGCTWPRSAMSVTTTSGSCVSTRSTRWLCSTSGFGCPAGTSSICW